MRKLLAFLAVLSVIIAPTLHLWCEGSCDEAQPTSACHHHQAPDRAFAPAHNCETHAQPPAVIVKSTAIPLPMLFAIAPSHSNADAGHLAVRGASLAIFGPLNL